MNVREPRFLIIDLHKRQVVPATTDEMQALLRREELTGETYFERKNKGDEDGFWRSIKSAEGR